MKPKQRIIIFQTEREKFHAKIDIVSLNKIYPILISETIVEISNEYNIYFSRLLLQSV